MTVVIDQKIVGFSVVGEENQGQQENKTYTQAEVDELIRKAKDNLLEEYLEMQGDVLDESLGRPRFLSGTTYKIRPPSHEGVDHAFYITINDITLNEGTYNEMRRPFEIFINTKDMSQFQWIASLTRVMSAVFRKGGDVTFLVEEMKAIQDPRGGAFVGSEYVHSVPYAIGLVLHEHFSRLGLMNPPKKKGQKNFTSEIAPLAVEKTEKAAKSNTKMLTCPKCSQPSYIRMDGCMTCTSCGYSKCG